MGYCSRCGEITPSDKCSKCGGRSVASIAANLGVEPILLADRWKSQYATSILGFGDQEASNETAVGITAPSVLAEPPYKLSKSCVTCHKIFQGESLSTESGSSYCKDCTPTEQAVVDRGACSGCYRPILATETHVEHSNRFWHKECFSCHTCSRFLGETPMVDLQGHPCCENCLMAQAGSVKRSITKPSPPKSSTRTQATYSTLAERLPRTSRQSLPPMSTLNQNSPLRPSTSIRTNSPALSSSPFGLNPRTSLYNRSKPFDSISSNSSSASSSNSLSSTLSSASSWSPSPSSSKSAKPRVDHPSLFKRPTEPIINDTSCLASPEPINYPPSPPNWTKSTRKENSALAEYRRAKAAMKNEQANISQDNILPSPSPSPPPRTTKIPPTKSSPKPIPSFSSSKLPTSYGGNNPNNNTPQPENCSGCRNPLSGTRVKLSTSAGDVWYHYDCLTCEGCKEPFSSSEYISDGKHFFHPKCRPSPVQSPEYFCHGCNKTITNKCLKNGTRFFHPDCFSCYECNVYLPFDQPFYEILGEAHCETCSRMDNLSIQANPPQDSSNSNHIAGGNSATVTATATGTGSGGGNSLVSQESTPRYPRNTLKLGGAKVCPHCRNSIGIMDEAPGPRATRWHKRCLQCQGCHKQMDSGANVVEGRSGEWVVWCRGCNAV
ncbi:C2H2-type zinc finger transcription factor [Phycomyces blakesleeanus]